MIEDHYPRYMARLLSGLFVLVLLVAILSGMAGVALVDTLRSHVVGEGLYSKSHKGAIASLYRYVWTKKPQYYADYRDSIEGTISYRRAREILEDRSYPREKSYPHFIRGGMHPNDAAQVAWVFRTFGETYLLRPANEIWRQADKVITELDAEVKQLHGIIESGQAAELEIQTTVAEIERLSKIASDYEITFSLVIGQIARDLEMAAFIGLAVMGIMLTVISFNFIIMVKRRSAGMLKRLNESQARLSHHFQNTPLGSLSFDTDFRITEWNLAAEKIFGYSADEVMGQRAGNILLSATVEGEVNKVWRMLLSNKGGTRSTNENLTKDGRTIICDWYNTPILGENGKVMGVMSLVEDITERKMLEEQINRSQKLEAVGQLTGGIAHDFNNLMAIVMGNLELVQEQSKLDPSSEQYITNALKALERGATLTKQLLSFSRRQVLTMSVTDIQRLVEDTLNLLERTIGGHIQIIREQTDAEIFVNIDGDIFGNAIVNLALNARDAMPDGGTLTFQTAVVELENEMIGLNKEPAHGRYALITVSDTGIGIRKDILEQVLEPFFTTKEVGKGSGLGLSMAYGFVAQSNGYLDITSKENVGTKVSIYLPIHDKE